MRDLNSGHSDAYTSGMESLRREASAIPVHTTASRRLNTLNPIISMLFCSGPLPSYFPRITTLLSYDPLEQHTRKKELQMFSSSRVGAWQDRST